MFSTEHIRMEVEQLDLLYLIQHTASRRNRCIYCQQPFEPSRKRKRRTRDHVIPKARLSEASKEFREVFCQSFVAPCCRGCNQLKGSKSLGEFREYLRAHWTENRILILSNLKKVMK